jgi:hypothetical protein
LQQCFPYNLRKAVNEKHEEMRTMTGKILLFIGAALPFLWGVAHLFPTRSVVRGFGDISEDNRNIIRMEWMIEGVALIFIGVLVAAITVIDAGSAAAKTAYSIASVCLLVLAVISLFTGFRIRFLPFRLCPAIFTVSAFCIAVGGMIL